MSPFEEVPVECPSTATRDTYQPFRIVAATVRLLGTRGKHGRSENGWP